MRKIAIIIGSASDLSQCQQGLEILNDNQQQIQVVGIYVRSIHRNTLDTQDLLRKLVELDVDIAIIGAGWANHLTGCCDAFYRYTLRNDKIHVIGVAFEDKTNERHTQAAVLSMTEVPGTKVIHSNDGSVFVGPSGFAQACLCAIRQNMPKINLPEPKAIADLTLEEAREMYRP